VVEAAFDPGAMRVRVDYVPGATDRLTIRRLVEELDYRVREATVPAAEASAADLEAAARADEYRALRRRFWVAAALSLPVLVIAMSHGAIPALAGPWTTWAQLALTTPVVLHAGGPFYRGAWTALRHRAADMNTLIAVGTGAAYLYSVAATLAPARFAGVGRGMPGMAGMAGAAGAPVYFEAAAAIIPLILLGRMLEARAKGQTGDAIRRLLGLQAKTARVVRAGREVDVPIDELVAGDVVVVRPGERLPVDGVVLDGASGGGRARARRGAARGQGRGGAAAAGRPPRRGRGGAPLARDDPHGEAEPVLGLRLRRGRDPGGRGTALPGHGLAPLAAARERGDVAVERERGGEQPPPPPAAARLAPTHRSPPTRSGRMDGTEIAVVGASAALVALILWFFVGARDRR
jgi:hypothetical protein